MPTYTVHVPPGLEDDVERAERTVFVREGFSLPGLVFGPFFLVYRGLWRATLVWCVAAIAISGLTQALGLPTPVTLLLFLVLAVLVGLEASEARRQALGRRGYIGSALITGATRSTIERTYFAESFATGVGIGAGRGGMARPPSDPTGTGPRQVIGLFPQPANGAPVRRS